MKVVFDTNVLISSTLWDSSVAQKLLFKLIEADIPIFSSIEIIAEYQKVLKRDFSYSEEEIVKIVEKVFLFVKIVPTLEKVNIIIKDPDDNKIIECAISSLSDYVVTYDKHLLELVGFRDIKIVKPEQLLKLF